jgi:hypothetical protein
MISIILVTNRVGGLDVLFSSLRAQSNQDFELVLVDELRPYRRHATEQVGKGTWHITPGTTQRWGQYMRALNRGLDYSRGDVLLFISDYTALHPDTLATHAKFHETHGPRDVALGAIEYCALPALHPDFPKLYGWSKIGHDPANYSDETYAPWLDFKRRHELYEEFREAYERDLDSGKLDPFMFSTFAEPFVSAEGLKVWQTNDRGPPSQFMNLKNDSCRRELLTGFRFDERADGTHGHQDSITHRQLAKLGAQFHQMPGAPVKNLDPHSVAIIRRKGLNDEANLKLAEAAQ